MVAGRGGDLVAAHYGEPDSLDPQRAVGAGAWVVYQNLYDTLVTRNHTFGVDPLVAESWTLSEDERVYTFRIRAGQTFHNGEPLDAAAVAFTYQRALDAGDDGRGAWGARAWLGPLRDVTALDARGVRLTLDEPFAPLLGNLSTFSLGILPPAATTALGDDFGRRPVGSGPWRLAEWTPGERIVLVPHAAYRNPRSWVNNHGAPLAERLIFRVLPDHAEQMAAFEAGTASHVYPPKREVRRMQADPRYRVNLPRASSEVGFLEFATDPLDGPAGPPRFRPPFDDLRVRRAVGYAVDPERLIAEALHGVAARVYGPLAAGLAEYDPAIERYGFRHDPARAVALLAEAGWTRAADGVCRRDNARLRVTLSVWDDPNQVDAARLIARQLGAVGFQVDLDVFSFNDLIEHLTHAPRHLNLMAIAGADPDNLRVLASQPWGMGNYRPAEYLALLDQGRRTSNPAARRRAYFAASRHVLEDAALIPLWTELWVAATRSEVRGFTLGPDAVNCWEDAWVAVPDAATD